MAMIALEEELGQEFWLTIDQVARLTGVRKSTLRYWEKSFADYLRPRRTESNRRQYSLKDVEVIKTIKRLIEEEHLTNVGVKLRLQQIFPGDAAAE